MDGLTLAAAQLSASRGATVGGDLYEAVPTVHGVRVVIGDVRGHGLPALGAAAAVLGAFREAAYDEVSLGGVMVRMERALGRHVRDRARAEHPSACPAEPESPSAEEFVTVLLLQIAPDGTLLALNCGHPWPYLLRSWGFAPGPAQRLTDVRALDGETMPPLGVLPLPRDPQPHACGELRPGETLFLHTDGAGEARNAAGAFFPLQSVLAEAPLTPARLVAGVHAALLRHTGGRLADDVALLVLRDDRS